jgi:hypothetical protein
LPCIRLVLTDIREQEEKNTVDFAITIHINRILHIIIHCITMMTTLYDFIEPRGFDSRRFFDGVSDFVIGFCHCVYCVKRFFTECQNIAFGSFTASLRFLHYYFTVHRFSKSFKVASTGEKWFFQYLQYFIRFDINHSSHSCMSQMDGL